MEESTSNLTPVPATSFVPSFHKPANRLLLTISIIFVFLLGGVLGYYLGTQSSQTQVVNVKEEAEEDTDKTPQLQETTNKGIGETTIYFLRVDQEVYLKQNTKFFSERAGFMNGTDRDQTWVYSTDSGMEPEKVSIADQNDPRWVEVMKVPVDDITESERLTVEDRVFSFQSVPGSESVLFVMEWFRSPEENSLRTESGSKTELVLYLYNPTSKELKTIKTFDGSNNDNAYPKIGNFSYDGKYVALSLFECWECDGHNPQTFLINLETFETRNLGNVIGFRWKWEGNGDYEYKDYIVVPCEEPGLGPCNQDPDTLPLKTGKL